MIFCFQESYSSTTTSRPWNSGVVTCWFKLLFLRKNRIYIAFTWYFLFLNLSVGQAAKFSNSHQTFSKCCFSFPNLFLWKPINKTPLDLWLFWGPSPTPFIMMLSACFSKHRRLMQWFWRIPHFLKGNVKNSELLLFWTKNYDCKLKTSEEWLDKLVHCS